MGPEPAVCTHKSGNMFDCGMKKTEMTSKGCRQAFIAEEKLSRLATALLQFSRQEAKTLMGHAQVNYHKHKRGRRDRTAGSVVWRRKRLD